MSAPACYARQGAVVPGARTALAGWRRSLPLRRAVVCATGPFLAPTSLFVLGRVEVPCTAAQWKRRPASCLCGLSFPEGKDGGGTSAGGEFVVVNFYHFVPIENPEAEVANHQMFLQERDIHGRIYINEQGINAQYSGLREDALAYAKWLKEDDRFSGILIQISPTLRGHAFPRLKLRYKPSLVQAMSGTLVILKELSDLMWTVSGVLLLGK